MVNKVRSGGMGLSFCVSAQTAQSHSHDRATYVYIVHVHVYVQLCTLLWGGGGRAWVVG